MRSSPQVTFSLTMRTISCWISLGSGGRPPRDFQRQYRLKALRCQRTKVAGVATVSALFQSKNETRAEETSGLGRSIAVAGSYVPGSRQAAFGETRFQQPTPYASGERSSGSEGRLGAVPSEWRKPSEDHAKGRDGRGTCRLRLAHKAGVEQSLLSLKLEQGSTLHRNSCISYSAMLFAEDMREFCRLNTESYWRSARFSISRLRRERNNRSMTPIKTHTRLDMACIDIGEPC